MSELGERVVFGRTGLQVSRLGVGSSYGVPTRACRRAFDAGVNYFFWGSVRSVGMGMALREIGRRDRAGLVLVLQAYVRSPKRLEKSVMSGLASLRFDHADVLLLGWHDELPRPELLDEAARLRERGLVRHIGVSSHQRPLFVEMMKDPRLEVFHLRYNAAHRGAEKELFARLPKTGGPGIASFTNTRWGDLLAAKNMPKGESPPSATDCYRFALSDPRVHVAITGPKDDDEMNAALEVLASDAMTEDELARMRRIGDHVHGIRSFMSVMS